ncbi:SEC-C metal-binding domain-containing protein [Aeromonas veronii]|uniref:SEC-C metal-binding domain-containing protein n=1 Tax=Aeromonas veronii TaxID=654 RepID=UPI0039C95EA5
MVKKPCLRRWRRSEMSICKSKPLKPALLLVSFMPTFWHNAASSPARSQPVVAPIKIGRNEPCPCGSGKKYKQCCLH